MPENDALRAAIAAEAAAMIAFVDLLEQEKGFLISGTVDEIIAITERKNTLLAQLGQASAARDKIFAELDLGNASATDIQGFLLTRDSNLEAAWVSLLDIARKANQANRVNASLVSSRLQQNQQALALLRAANGDVDLGATYGPDGQTTMSSNRRPLGSA